MKRVLTFAVVLSSAACTSATSGTASSTGVTPPTSTGSATTIALAPPVSGTKLDLTDAKAKPCEIVTDSVMATFNVGVPGVADPGAIIGPSCAYPTLSVDEPLILVGVNTKSGGLEGLYQRRSTFAVFEAMTVSGYPVVNILLSKDDRECSLSAALNDAELLNIDYTAGPRVTDDACVPASKLLATAIANVKAQQ